MFELLLSPITVLAITRFLVFFRLSSLSKIQGCKKRRQNASRACGSENPRPYSSQAASIHFFFRSAVSEICERCKQTVQRLDVYLKLSLTVDETNRGTKEIGPGPCLFSPATKCVRQFFLRFFPEICTQSACAEAKVKVLEI